MTRARPLGIRVLSPFRHTERARTRVVAGAAVVLGLGLVVACSGTGATDTLSPITGITVRAETLTTGRGCGRGPTQIFRYAVAVLGRDPNNLASFTSFIAGNVYDCFSDAQFTNVPASGGSFDYRLQVVAYTEAAYLAAGDARIRAAAVNPADLAPTNPTFSTTCTAQEVAEVQALAACDPLSPGAGALLGTPSQPAAVAVSTATFKTAAGLDIACGASYATVRYRTDVNGTPGATAEVPCTAPITVSPAVAPASYVVQIALLRADGSVVGQTSCSALTNPGVTSSATCQPVQ